MPAQLSFYADILVPLGAAFLGGLLSLLAGLLIVARSETFRKHAFWESRAKDLWNQQLNVCRAILTLANRVMNSAIYCFDVFNPDKESQSKHVAALQEHLVALSDLKGQRLTFCTPNLNQSVEALVQQMIVIVQQYAAGNLKQNLSLNLPSLWFGVVDDARTELGVERLDAQARSLIEKACKAPSFNPTGNSTLPY